jgi:ribosomal protein S18 acetylase RimI-like enzyme
MDELRRVIDFERRLIERLAERRARTRFGTAYFCDSLPLAWWLNVLSVDLGTRATVAELVEDADAAQAGLRHRKVAIDHELGAEVEPGFRALGWRVERLVVMAQRGTGRAVDGSAVEEIDPAELAPVWAEGIRRGPYGADEETVRQLVAAQHLRRRAVAVRYFAARVGERIASYCELFSDGRTAQVESVMTLEEFRGRGLATAVVGRAAAEARASGHDLVFLDADDEDWPKELYRKLGFAEIGRIWDFVREPTSARPGRTPPATPAS